MKYDSVVVVTTQPFGKSNPMVLEKLYRQFVHVRLNDTGGRLNGKNLYKFVKDAEYIIAGTELYSLDLLEKLEKLKGIFRVGIGLDGLPLKYLKKRKIPVYYTPDAPAPAVSELAVSGILTCLRNTVLADRNIRNGIWDRTAGKRVSEAKIGILGVGRIGSRVISRLHGFGTPQIFANDLSIDRSLDRKFKINWTDLDTIMKVSDVVSVHLPLTHITRNLITSEKLALLGPESSIVNTSRGGIVDEKQLDFLLKKRQLKFACIDVFNNEPYKGPLTENPYTLLTSHLGSMTNDCRARMELEALDDLCLVCSGKIGERPIDISEYENSEN